ncbi:PH domain-containing protein [Hyphococcus luteus]|uniref:YdbS-like PH domain-containing protein n=1 Tax=Hyphococcus luteus TaxID=2058213 RepID=A0A2S7K3S3_9PROT|nr:PH domain-containing protein [Marinicaulis flavus]PQA87149.1 hypothetical protein CW354_14010 [Marinicaulis flavus]
MSYISKTLGQHEIVISSAHFHWLYWIGAWLALLSLGLVGVGFIIFFHLWVTAATTEIVVTNHRVVVKTGWLRRYTRELPIRSIELVTIQQGFWARIFGYGRLVIHGSGDADIKIRPIANPLLFRKAIENVSNPNPDWPMNAKSTP